LLQQESGSDVVALSRPVVTTERAWKRLAIGVTVILAR
jgi:hypothetical protein